MYPSQSLKLFGNYPDEVLLELSRYAVYTSFLGKVTRKLERREGGREGGREL